MAAITQHSRITSHLLPGDPVYSPDIGLSSASSSTTTNASGNHHGSILSPPSETTFEDDDDDDEGFSQAYASAAIGFFTAPPPLPPSRMDQNNSMPSPFSFFASTTSSNEDPRDKPQSNMKTLKIELANSELVLMTGKTTTLQGVLHVNLQKNTKVKSLQIEFSGRSSVTWVDGMGKHNKTLKASLCNRYDSQVF
jgi:hypothetical protein